MVIGLGWIRDDAAVDELDVASFLRKDTDDGYLLVTKGDGGHCRNRLAVENLRETS